MREMDDEDCERRRMECLDEMSNLEKQFTDLKDQLYKERLSQVDAKLQEVIAGKAPEYLEPLATLQENMQIRTKSEKLLLYDTVQSELEEKIRRLEEDRHSIDITSGNGNDVMVMFTLSDTEPAMATLGPHRVKTEPPVKLEKHLHSARSEEGRLYYDGEWYIRGQTICIDKKDECPTRYGRVIDVCLWNG
ncbi:hypothetical protein GH733_001630 [Mirounga leonina]|nr:hypothetical protein GH733_004735 [Mirounga leonina]KAF3830762.1 hypothetical protein GH733_001630 [Mirounga leonina]